MNRMNSFQTICCPCCDEKLTISIDNGNISVNVDQTDTDEDVTKFLRNQGIEFG